MPNKKLLKINEIEGYENDFIEYVIRLVRVLGVTSFYARIDNNQQLQRFDHIGDLRNHLTGLIIENQKTIGFKEEETI